MLDATTQYLPPQLIDSGSNRNSKLIKDVSVVDDVIGFFNCV
jgi:hypothetical protein